MKTLEVLQQYLATLEAEVARKQAANDPMFAQQITDRLQEIAAVRQQIAILKAELN